MATAEPAAVIRVAAICGSLRKASCNRGLIRCAIQMCEESIPGMEIELVEIDNLPFVNTDLEEDGTYPPIIEEFRQKIFRSDAVFFAFPEYNYSLPAPLKNAIDWASRPPNMWADKAAAIVTVAGGSGGKRSQYHLRQVGVFLDLHFINKPELFIEARRPSQNFDSNGDLIDTEIKEKLRKILLSLLSFSRRLQNGSQNNGRCL